MKTDRLEDFIIENKEEFNSLKPSKEVWNRIQKKKSTKKSINLNWKSITIRAAAVIVIFISSYYFHDFINKNKNLTAIDETNFNLEQTPLYKNLIEAELYYSSEINFRKQELFKLTSNSPSLQNEVNIEFSNLDKLYKDLKNDLNDNADNQEVIEAMIQNYRIKLEILVDMLNQINTSKQKTIHHEEIHSTI